MHVAPIVITKKLSVQLKHNLAVNTTPCASTIIISSCLGALIFICLFIYLSNTVDTWPEQGGQINWYNSEHVQNKMNKRNNNTNTEIE